MFEYLLRTPRSARLSALALSTGLIVFCAALQAQAAATKPPATPAPAPAAGPARQLLVTLRSGTMDSASSTTSRTTSSRSTASDNEEQSVRVQDGAKAILTLGDSSPSATRQSSGTQSQSQSVLEIVPKLAGNSVTVQIQSLRASSDRGASQWQNVATTITTPLSVWTEISGRGPWGGDEASQTTSSRSTHRDVRRLYLKVDEIRVDEIRVDERKP